MCVTFLALDEGAVEDQWRLVLINNRDEDYRRPTAAAQWRNGVLCGRDMFPGREGGTWLAASETGRIAVLMNIVPPEAPNNASQLKSRGFLVQNFVSGRESPLEYAEMLSRSARSYAGFAMVLLSRMNGNAWRMAYFTNQSSPPVEALDAGVYGFGNSPRCTQLAKVEHGLDLFRRTCAAYPSASDRDVFAQNLLTILTDKRRCYPDDVLKKYQSDKSEELVRCLSSCFVEFPPPYRYGTRTHTVLLIDGRGRATYLEKNLQDSKHWTSSAFDFVLKDSSPPSML